MRDRMHDKAKIEYMTKKKIQKSSQFKEWYE